MLTWIVTVKLIYWKKHWFLRELKTHKTLTPFAWNTNPVPVWFFFFFKGIKNNKTLISFAWNANPVLVMVDSLVFNIYHIALLLKQHSAPCVLANITWGAVKENSRREKRASGSSKGERYHCSAVWLLTGSLRLVQVLSACEVIVPTHCVLVVLFFCFSFGRWPAIGCSDYCTLGDSFWHCNCPLWARR